MPDFTDRAAVIAFAASMAKKSPKFAQYVYQVPGRANLNITMQPEVVRREGGTIIWQSNASN